MVHSIAAFGVALLVVAFGLWFAAYIGLDLMDLLPSRVGR
jgi:hypothetical protein